jgi:putative transposase
MPPAKNGTLNCDARSKYMPRLARTVFADVPHHVTQRGNRKENVFFVYNDYRTYLEWLGQYSQEYGVEILAYCLMTNHVHLIVIPRKTDSLEKTFKPLHMRYAQWINRRKGWKGHLWQGRYFSSPLDEHYMWASIRYAELNPVRARMVDRAEDYSWSSAAAHCGIRNDDILSNELKQSNVSIRVDDWSSWLVAGENSTESALIKRNVMQLAGKNLRFRPRGRPPARQQHSPAGKG